MKLVVAGNDADGRSYVVRETPIDVTTTEVGYGFARVWDTAVVPPELDGARPGLVDALPIDLGIPRGGAAASLATMPPHFQAPTHRTETFDVSLLTQGSAELVLDTATVPVAAGDWVLMSGVLHSWTTGDEGCVIVGVAFGIGPV